MSNLCLRGGDMVAPSGMVRARRAGGRKSLYLEALETRSLLSAFFVSAAGSDGGAGTLDSPWKTLQKAANTVQAGDVVTVQAGTYAGFMLTSSHSGTATNRITFTAQSGVVINTCGPNSPDAINLEGASYITIEGFNINNSLGTITRGGIRAVTDSNVIIRNNTVDGAGDWNIFTGFSDDVLIENNVASHALTQHGIYVSNSGDRPIIRGNVVFGNHNCGIHMNGDLSMGGDGIISGALVENNVIYDNSIGGGSAINADGVQNSIFRNNLIYDNHASGISLFKMDGAAGSTGNLVINNTIILPSDARWCVNIANGSTGNTVTNNILDNRNTSHGAITVSSDSLGGLKSDYNLVINNRFTPNASTYMTLAQWQPATAQDMHSVLTTEAAIFSNAAANDYHLVSSTYDAGVISLQPGATPAPTPSPTPTPTPAPTQSVSSTKLVSSSSTITVGQMLTFTAVVNSADGSLAFSTAPVDVNGFGNVTLMDGSKVIGTAAVDSAGQASFSTSALTLGVHAIAAVFSGNANFTGSTSDPLGETVLSAPITDPVIIVQPTSRQTVVSLNGRFNTTGFYNEGSTFNRTAGLDKHGNAYSANQLGTSITAGGSTFTLRTGNMNDVVSMNGQTVTLPTGSYSKLMFVGTGVNGVQTGTFTVHYTDGTSQTFTQSMSDWSVSSHEAGEIVAKTMSTYVKSNGQIVQRTTNLYAYTLSLDSSKTVASIVLASNINMKVMAMNLLA